MKSKIMGFLGILLGLTLIRVSEGRSQAPPDDPRHSTSLAGDKQPPPRVAYAGDKACNACHREEATTYLKTAHHFTSSLPSEHSIQGKFGEGSNILRTSNPALIFMMSANKEGFFESAVREIAPSKTAAFTERIGLVVGAGRKAQTYLFWKGDQLFELPVSYWTESGGEWVNSPGYPDGSVHFDRAIVPRCLECHGSSFESLAPPANRFSQASLVLGITCEKCHGPGREHVALYSSKSPPPHGAAKAIVNPALLSRERQMDVCSLCHAGAALPIAPSLSFVPGDVISEYLELPDPGPKASVDVHGNQVLLLQRSRCFESSKMTCTTCHNVHKEQREAATFSQRCLTCHKVETCGEFPKLGNQIARGCVDCHMPLQKSEALFSDSNSQKVQPRIRNHRIAIYADAQLP